MPTHSRSFARTLAWRVPLGYFVLGATWIVASDWSLHADSGGLTAVAVIGMFKGLGFVLVSALLLGVVLRRLLARIAADQDRLVDSEARLRLLVDSLPDHALYVFDTAGRVVDWNASAHRLHGDATADVLGGRFEDFFTPEDRALGVPAKALTQAAHDGVHRAEGWRLRRDGTRFWAVVSISALRDADGRLRGFAALSRDVTVTRAAEAAHLASEQRLAAALTHARIGWFEHDVPAGRVRASATLAEMMGLATVDGWAPFETFISALHPQDAPEVGAAIRHALQQGGPFDLVYRVVRADGDERSLELVGTVEHDDDSRPLRVVGTVLDVTQRVRARHALERQRAQLAGVIDSALDAIISLDVRLDVVMINPAAERVFGVRAEEMLGRSLARLIPTTARDRLAEQLQTYAAGSVDVPPMIGGRGVTGLHADGHEFPIEFAVSKVTIADEQFLTVILRDITERERDRNALEAQSVRLQRLSLRLLEVQEQEKRHLARELHDELGQLLTATKLRVQQLGATQPAVHELSADLDRALTQVRTMSLDLRPSMLDDLGLVAALRWYVNRQATLGRFEMKFDASGLETRPDPAVETAAFRIVQEALTNVLRHARATKVMVRVWRDDARLRLEVRDDGCGFDPARRSGSSGLLGMRERATLLGGNLTLDSAPGRGCTVSADLPFSPTLPGPRETTDG